MTTRAVLHLCATCDPAGFETACNGLQQALNAANLPASVHAQPCMNACADPVSLALQADARATYFFAGINPITDRVDIVATVAAYLNSPHGWIEDATVCGRLRHCLKGRVPALNSGS